MKWYGSINNRLEENKQFCKEIEVGTGCTEYLWSDREAYEVIAVRDQKHVTIRRCDHKHIGEAGFDNNWELISNENNPTYDLVKRGKYWYSEIVATADMLDCKDDEEKLSVQLFLAHNNIDSEELKERGRIRRYHKMNISFGVADYYYDYSF